MLEVSAVLTDLSGNPAQNEMIDFSYRLTSATAFNSGGTGTTDATGTASVTLDLSPGVYDFMAAFAGDMVYLASSVEVQYDTSTGVTTFRPSLLPLAGVAFLATFVGLAAFIRKRSRR